MSAFILNWMQAFMSALVPALFALALVWLRQHQVNTTVLAAVGRAAGEAYKQILQSGGEASNPVGLAAAIAEGREYLLARIPDALRAAGVTPEGAAQMVSAELGKLLALDPTISVAAPAQMRSHIDVSGAASTIAGGETAAANTVVAVTEPSRQARNLL